MKNLHILMALMMTCTACSRQSVRKQDPPVEGRIIADDGVIVRYQVSGQGEPALVFVHGWSCDRSIWKHQLQHFAKRHKVVALDLPGHGTSLGFHRRSWTMEAYGSDVIRILEELHLTHVAMIGHSMGGAVMLEVARQAPERVMALIGVETLHNVEAHLTETAIRQFVEPLRARFKEDVEFLVRRAYFVPGTDPALVDDVVRMMRSSSPPVVLGAMEELLHYDATKTMQEVAVPIRCINSDLHPTDVAAGKSHAESFDVVLMRGLGHFPMLEEPDAFNALLEAVIEEVRISLLNPPAEQE